MRPVSIKRKSERELQISWDDGHSSVFSYAQLRDICPCASCSGEQVLLYRSEPVAADKTTPGRYELSGIQQVGSYAVQLEWKDGHNTGIYSWDYLREHCPCDQCSSRKEPLN